MFMYAIGAKFPSFNLTALNSDKSFSEVDITKVDGWKVVYFYPKDFTFVCPTEIVDFDNLMPEFCKLGATVFGVSPDNEYCKLAWRDSHPHLKNLNHALCSDGNALAGELGIISEGRVPFRVTYVIDSENTIQYVGAHGLSVGRSAAEVLRVLDSCQKGEEGFLCPAARPVGGVTL
jgi:peroxiredoxin (alkyl hydroperoxide reductase subunit C)